MKSSGQRVMYTYHGPGREVPWSEIRRALHEQLARGGTLALTITCDQVTSGAPDCQPEECAEADTGKSERHATIWDVAREAQVSVATVSRVLNKRPHVGLETQMRIEAAMQRLDFQPNEAARAMVRSRHGRVPDNGVENPFTDDDDRLTTSPRSRRTRSKMNGDTASLLDEAS